MQGTREIEHEILERRIRGSPEQMGRNVLQSEQARQSILPQGQATSAERVQYDPTTIP